MSALIGTAPDVEVGLMQLVREQFPVLATSGGGRLRVATETPDDLPTIVTDSAPFLRITDIAPRRSGRLEVNPTVDFDLYWRGRSRTRTLAVQIEAWMLSYPHSVTTPEDGFMLIDGVIVSMGPQRVPFAENSNVERYYSSYQLSARR